MNAKNVPPPPFREQTRTEVGEEPFAPLASEWLQRFIYYLRVERGVSENTLLAYRQDLSHFFHFLEKQFGVAIDRSFPIGEKGCWNRLSSAELRSFLAAEKARNLHLSTLARRTTVLKLFFRFLILEGELPPTQDPSAGLEGPKQWRTLPPFLTVGEIERLLEVPDRTTAEGLCNAAWMELLYSGGLRISEVCALSLYDVSDDSVRVMGKGSKERVVPVAARAIAVVDRYLNEIRWHHNSEREQHLFLNLRGKPLSRVYAWSMIKRYAQQAGLSAALSPHSLRHAYATHLLENGADIRIIQELLGHASIATTDRYAQVNRRQLIEAFSRHHPRNF